MGMTLERTVKSGWFLEHYLKLIPLDKTPFIVGRGGDSALKLALGVISRHHAELIWDEEEKNWMLRDLESTNGSFINDKSVGNRPHKIMTGDFLRVASVEMRLVYMPQGKAGVEDKRTDVLGRLPDRTLSMKDKIERAMGYVIRQGNCSAQELADTLNVERSTLYRHVNQEFGRAPSELLREKRLVYAADLLTTGKYSVQQVADKTGFESPAHFSRSFKKYFNIVPSQYVDKADKNPKK